jgi:predicted TPR repeat methyltransferase
MSWRGTDQNKAAVDAFNFILSIYPDSWMAYDGLSYFYENSGDVESASKSYKHSLEKNPKDDHAASQLKKLQK